LLLAGSGGVSYAIARSADPAVSPSHRLELIDATTSEASLVNSQPATFQLVFSDDFSREAAEGNFLSTYTNWSAYPWAYRDTSGKGRYDPDIISASDGVLSMRLHTDSLGQAHVAAPVPNLPGGIDQLYGRYEVRFRADAVAGYKAAWLLWPQSDEWPRDGEINFPEGDLGGTFGAFMHHQDGSDGNDQDYAGTSARFTDWHTAVIEWTPTAVGFLLDGQVVGSFTERIPSTPMHWVLQTETVLNGDVPPESTGNVLVDSVKVWKYAG